METERVKVEGITFNVNKDRLGGWHAFKLLSKANEGGENNFAIVDAFLELACYITGLTEDDFIKKCGGEDVQVQRIIEIIVELVKRAYPKN